MEPGLPQQQAPAQNPQPMGQQPAQTVNAQTVASDDAFQKMIPTKNVPSLISYYLGIFGLIPFLGLPFAIGAVVLGHIAMKQFRANPTPGAKGHAMTGLILGYFEIACFLIFIGFMILASMYES